MLETKENKTFTMTVPPTLYMQLRILAAKSDLSLGELCRRLLKEGVEKKSTPKK